MAELKSIPFLSPSVLSHRSPQRPDSVQTCDGRPGGSARGFNFKQKMGGARDGADVYSFLRWVGLMFIVFRKEELGT